MTAHEVFVSLFWLVAAGYLFYLVWFVITSFAGRHTQRAERDTKAEVGAPRPRRK